MRKFILIQFVFISLLLTMNIQNASAHHEATPKKGILLVTFGTSYPEARVAFDNIEKQVRELYPDVEVRWAFTSIIIRRILDSRGEHIDSPVEALAKMGEDGFTHVAVQSLHVIPGEEYHNLMRTVMSFNPMPEGVHVARLSVPLLSYHDDNQKLVDILYDEFKNDLKDEETAVLFMGHGTEHPANIYYPGIQCYLSEKSDKMFLGAIEGFPVLDQIIPKLKARGVKKVVLTPFMSVAGEHANEDMAGSGSDSWKSILEKEGFEVEIIMKGLAEYDDVVGIWIDHLSRVYAEMELPEESESHMHAH